MAQSFFIDQKIMVKDSYSARHAPSYSMKIFTGFFTKRSSHSRFSADKYDACPEGTLSGPYVGYKDAPAIRECNVCGGSGKAVPEGFAPSASYRVPCTACDGTGQRDYSNSYPHYCINRSDYVMSLDAYAPIAERKIQARLAQERAEQARQERLNNLVQQLLTVAHDPTSEDLELAVAKWLRSKSADELRAAADRVVESRKPRCINPTCNEPAAEYESYKGLCYSDYYAAKLAEQTAEEVNA